MEININYVIEHDRLMQVNEVAKKLNIGRSPDWINLVIYLPSESATVFE